jgi:hypothetical protein
MILKLLKREQNSPDTLPNIELAKKLRAKLNIDAHFISDDIVQLL